MRKMGGLVLGGILMASAGGLITLARLHAQTNSAPPDTIVSLVAGEKGLPLADPLDFIDGGTFWLMTPDGLSAPMPCPPRDPAQTVFQISSGQFVVDATGGQVTTNGEPATTIEAALAVQADAMVKLVDWLQGLEEVKSMKLLARAMGMDLPDFGDEGGGGEYTNNFTPFVIDTNQLWLEITNVASGYANLSLHSGTNQFTTNQVYAILTKTNLTSASWDIEAELFPTTEQTNVIPFTLPQWDRNILFVRAQDWTGVDSNGDGVPDWWLWKYFGTLDLNATNLDSTGLHNLGEDFTNGVDPNVITFSVDSANDYVNTTTASAQLKITAGTPSYYAILVNHQTTTNWQTFVSTNLAVDLGSADGVYAVTFGLRGLPTDATQTWIDYDFTLDRLAPAISFTNPILASGTATVIKPYLQLQGYADEPLVSLSYDLTNNIGVATNLDAFVTDQVFDAGKADFTTNFFQAYDVPLATNVNLITFRATDRAGNTMTTNFNVVLDYAGATNLPVVTVIWPTNGMAVSGSNITIYGTMSDETGTIQAQVINGDGTTNAIAGLVERNGMFWMENVPLNGTNLISLQATDGSGRNPTTNSFTVFPSSLDLRIDYVPMGDALYQAFGSVNGSVSDPSATVTVNGITATVRSDLFACGGGYYWSAENVPIVGQGTATFNATASVSGTPPANTVLAEEMGAYVLITEHHVAKLTIQNDSDGSVTNSSSYSRVKEFYNIFSTNLTYLGGRKFLGSASDNSASQSGTNSSSWTENDVMWSDWDSSAYQTNSSGDSWYGSPLPPEWDDYEYFTSLPDWDLSVIGWAGEGGIANGYPPTFVYHYFANNVHHHWHWDFNGGGYIDRIADVTARTKVKLLTGGKAKLNRQNLFCLQASAVKYLKPPEGGWGYTPTEELPKDRLRVLGKWVGADGKLWVMLPDNTEQDITVAAPAKHYDAGTDAQKYTLQIEADGAGKTTFLRPDEIVNDANYCVGQSITFQPFWQPETPPYLTGNSCFHWSLPGNFFNAEMKHYTNGSLDPFVNSDTLTHEVATNNWWVSGSPPDGYKASVGMNLHFPNGQNASIAALGKFSIYRPTATMTTITTNVGVHNDVLEFGNGISLDNGITFFYSFDPSSFPGDASFLQVVLNTTRQLQDSNSVWHSRTEYNSPPYLDNPDPYNQKDSNENYADSPGIDLSYYSSFLRASVSESFEMWLMFQPTGGHRVPLRAVNWSWSGSATNSSNGWSCSSGTNSQNPTSFDTETYPAWTDDVTNWHFTPHL